MHAYHGKHPRLTFPRILGHEFAGEIVALGSEVTRFRVGQRGCCDIDLPCGTCGPCLEGRSNICEKLRTMGFDCDGAYAEFAAVPEFNLYPLPEAVSYDQAATVQVLGISYHAVVDRVKPKPGEKVCVIAPDRSVLVPLWSRSFSKRSLRSTTVSSIASIKRAISESRIR